MNLGMLEASAKDPEQVSQMFDANELAHQQVIAAVMALGVNIIPQSWPMAVKYPPDASWVEHHSDEHVLWAGILSLDNPGDLNQYDLSNPRQFTQWIDLHVQHHQLVSEALGLL